MARRVRGKGRREENRSPAFSAREILGWVGLAALVFVIYSSTFNGPFVFDDKPNITQNEHIRLSDLQMGSLRAAAFESPSSNRPLANLSFALNHYVGGYEPSGYRAVNIAIHIAVGILLYLLAKATLSLPSLRSRAELPRWVPLAVAALWLVHPVQIQSVTYVVQRMNSLAALFYLLSMLLYVKARLEVRPGRRRRLFAGCTLAGALSLASKEIAATLPFFILLYEWFFLQDLNRAWIRRRLLPAGALLIGFGILAFLYLGADPVAKILGSYETRDFTLSERLLTQFRVLIFYLSLLAVPHPSRLALDYDFPVSHSLLDPVTTLICISTVAGLLGLAVLLRDRERLLSFAILWFFGTLAIESSIIGLEIIFIHRTYLPATFLCLAAVALLARQVRWQSIGVSALATLTLLFAFWTYQLNGVWHDEVTLWKDGVEKAPGKDRPHINLGNALESRGHLSEALAQYERAIEIRPDFAETHYNAGIVLHGLGRRTQAIEFYRRALELDPEHAKAHNNLGRSLASIGLREEAKTHYRRALELKPNHASSHQNLGALLADEGQHAEAIEHYRTAIQIQPNLKEAHAALGVALASQGKHEEAIVAYRRALRIDPQYAVAHYYAARSLAARGEIGQAQTHYRQALRIRPDWPEAKSELAQLTASGSDEGW